MQTLTMATANVSDNQIEIDHLADNCVKHNTAISKHLDSLFQIKDLKKKSHEHLCLKMLC